MGALYHAPPAADEIEVSVFGRGNGEAIAVHVGDGRWLTVDSCLDEAGEPVAAAYLRHIGIAPEEAIRLVTVSHWDSDHIGGLAALLRDARAAQFACASTLHDPSLIAAIRTWGTPQIPDDSKRSVDQFAAVFAELQRRGTGPVWALRGTVLWEEDDLRVWSLSPSSLVHAKALTTLVNDAKRDREPSKLRRNYLSMVTWIEVGAQRLLLGGDLETRPADPWAAVIASPGRRGERGHIYKVSHHGSANGDDLRIWNELLERDVPAAVTAFTSRRLPSVGDRRRLRARAGEAYLAGARVAAPVRDPDLQRQIGEATASRGTTPLTGALGHIRMRASRNGAGSWTVRWFGNAARI